MAEDEHSGRQPEKLIFELSSPGRRGTRLPEIDVPSRPLDELLPQESRRSEPPPLPQVSEALNAQSSCGQWILSPGILYHEVQPQVP